LIRKEDTHTEDVNDGKIIASAAIRGVGTVRWVVCHLMAPCHVSFGDGLELRFKEFLPVFSAVAASPVICTMLPTIRNMCL
jgi:hypothetical protein